MDRAAIDNDRRLIFLHLPKTGGTSLHHQLGQAFGHQLICPERFSRLEILSDEELATYRFFSGHYHFDQIRLVPGARYVLTVLRDPIERVLSNYYFWRRHRPAIIEAFDLDGPRIARNGTLLTFLESEHPVVRESSDNQVARYLAGNVEVDSEGRFHLIEDGSSRPITRSEVLERALSNLSSIDTVGFVNDLEGVYATVASDWGWLPIVPLPRLNTRTTVDDNLEEVLEEETTPAIASVLHRFTELDRIVYDTALAGRSQPRSIMRPVRGLGGASIDAHPLDAEHQG
jgi:hypothetical protein